MLKGNDVKIFNKNLDKACTVLKLKSKERRKFYATNQVHENQCIGLIVEFVKQFCA
jgi:hypothetical protein